VPFLIPNRQYHNTEGMSLLLEWFTDYLSYIFIFYFYHFLKYYFSYFPHKKVLVQQLLGFKTLAHVLCCCSVGMAVDEGVHTEHSDTTGWHWSSYCRQTNC